MMDQARVLRIVGEMRDWRWSEKGRTPGAVDCFGFILYFYRICGIPIPDYEYSSEEAGAALFYENYHRHAEEVPLAQAVPGDLVFIKTPEAAHVGIYIGGGRIAHCSRHRGVTIQPVGQHPLNKFKASFYRIKSHAA